MTEEPNDNSVIRQNAEQLLQRVEKREQLLKNVTKQFPTPQQQHEIYQQSIRHDKNERRNAEESLRHHGYLPKVERRRVVLNGKVYVEEIDEVDSDGDCSFVSCVEEEVKQHVQYYESPLGAPMARSTSKDEWVHLASSVKNKLAQEADDDWEPLISDGGVPDSSHDVHSSADEANETVTNQSNSSIDSQRNREEPDQNCQEVIQSNTTDIAIHKEKDDNNPLLWIGGGIAFVGAVAGLAFANAKKKEHYEKKSGKIL